MSHEHCPKCGSSFFSYGLSFQTYDCQSCKHSWSYSGPEKIDHSKEEIVKPKRYNRGTIEVWDFILDWKLGFLEGNVIKYICRSPDKNGLEDLKKARVYLDKLISEEEKKAKK